jgi:hypothetical protein
VELDEQRLILGLNRPKSDLNTSYLFDCEILFRKEVKASRSSADAELASRCRRGDASLVDAEHFGAAVIME